MPDLDYDALAKARLSTKVESFDMITAVTQDALNKQFVTLWNDKDNTSIQTLSVTVTKSDGTVVETMHSSMGAPRVRFRLGTGNKSVVFFLVFKEGWFTWYDTAADEKKTTKIKNWTLAFNVNLDIRPTGEHEYVASVLKKLGVGNPGDYEVMQLLVDFTTAALMTYREDLSDLPGINADANLTIDQKASMRTAFVSAVNTYVTKILEFEKQGHPHTIYNIPRFKKPSVYHAPTIPPTALTFQCYPFSPSEGKEDPEGSGRNMLLYLEMTEDRALPKLQLNTSSNWVVPARDGKGPDGAVALSLRIFLEGWLIPKLAIINKSTDVSASYAAVWEEGNIYHTGYNWTNVNDPTYDYNFKRVTTATPSKTLTWEFHHNTHKEASDAYAEEKVDAWVTNTITVEPGQLNGTSTIHASGTSKAQQMCLFKDSGEGATVWGKFTWQISFTFSIDDKGELVISLYEPKPTTDSHKEPNAAGDKGVTYTPDPIDAVTCSMPSSHFTEMEKKLQTMFCTTWPFFFAGSEVFKFKRAVFNNEGDFLVDLHYQ